jgi:hypothetical protein
VADIKQGESVIYVYWPASYNGNVEKRGIKATDFTIYANGTSIGKLVEGGYIPFRFSDHKALIEAHVNFGFGKAGLLDVATAETTKLSVNTTTDGNTVFVRCTSYSDTSGLNLSMPGIVNQLKLQTVSSSLGEPEIKNCRLLE